MTVDFDPATHTYRAGGRVVPGVTRVLEPLIFDGFHRTIGNDIPIEVLRHAAERGQAVHAACHYLDENDLDTSTLDPAVVPYVDAWAKFKADTRLTILAMETVIHSERHGYAGRLDRIIDLDEMGSSILEIKSTAQHPELTAPLQTAAYLEAFLEMQGKASIGARRRYCVVLRPDGDYRLHTYPASTQRLHFSLFLSALQLHNWRMNHGQ